MTKTIPASLMALALVAAPAIAQDDAASQTGQASVRSSNMDAQITRIGNLTEMTEMTVVRLHAAPQDTAESESGADASGMSDDDLLLSGVGERTILTGEDEDEGAQTAATAVPEQSARPESDAPQTEADADTPAETPADSPLQAAIEQNEVLSSALQERDIALETIVAVEIREGTNVIVYTDES